tara:strand:+ start:1851 stop:2153 length:303 start_codon:yes stop_codon:yes gene_type:complete
MINVRFLDQVPVAAYANNGSGVNTLPRVLLPGQTFTIEANTQQTLYNFTNFGLLTINAGTSFVSNGLTYSTDGALQIETIMDNQGIIINNGIIFNSPLNP